MRVNIKYATPLAMEFNFRFCRQYQANEEAIIFFVSTVDMP